MAGKYVKSPETPHVTIFRAWDDEYRVTYKGLLPERGEAMAYYTDCLEDALGTAKYMEEHREGAVLDSDISKAGRVHWPDRWTQVRNFG